MRIVALFAVVSVVAYFTVQALQLFHVTTDDVWVLLYFCIGGVIILWITYWIWPPRKPWKQDKVWFDE